jgi:hypothetical protein
LQLNVGLLAGQLDSFVVVVDGNSELLLRFVLADDVLIEESFDLRGLGKVYVLWRRFVVLILVDDVLTYCDALIADKYSRARDQFANVILAFVAE